MLNVWSGWVSGSKDKRKGLKDHIARKRHKWFRQHAHKMVKRDVQLDKLQEAQKELATVAWDGKVRNCWRLQHPGSIFQAATPRQQHPGSIFQAAIPRQHLPGSNTQAASSRRTGTKCLT